MCVLFLQNCDKSWYEHGRTEVVANTLDPAFSTKFTLVYRFEEQQKLKFAFYDVDSPHSRLGDHHFLGEAECSLGQIVSAETFTANLSAVHSLPAGQLVVSAQDASNSKEVVDFVFTGRNLRKGSLFSSPDPFLSIYRANSSSSEPLLVYRSPYIDDTVSPNWPKFTLPLRSLKERNQPIGHLTIECTNYNRNGKHTPMGQVKVSTADLLDGPKKFDLLDPVGSDHQFLIIRKLISFWFCLFLCLFLSFLSHFRRKEVKAWDSFV